MAKRTRPKPKGPQPQFGWTTYQPGSDFWQRAVAQHGTPPEGIHKAHLSGCRRYLVLEGEFHLDGVGVVTHLWCRRLQRNPAWPWYVLQQIKDDLTSPDRTAIEVYPAHGHLVDQADMRHLWVYPEGYELPFGLHPGAQHC